MTRLVQLQRGLQSHILDSDATIAADIESSPEISAETRLRIYFDAYRLRLIEALEANYPVLAKLMGGEEFSRMTQQYLLVHPSQHFSIRWFGHRLSEFLAAFPDYREQPGLAELAEWEWKIATAFDASDAAVLTVEDLGRIAPEQWPTLRFVLHPSVQRISLTTNVVAIVKAAAQDELLPLPARLDRVTETDSEWLIWRQHLTVQYRSLTSTEATALDSIRTGASFEAMCEELARKAPLDEVPLLAATFLKQWIGEQCIKGLSLD